MEVTILSMAAAAAGQQNCCWRGELPIYPYKAYSSHPEDDTTLDDELINNLIFRKLNRVTDQDCEFLDKLGFDLPSLSVGDVIVRKGTAWRVDGVGFSPFDFSPLSVLLKDVS